MSKSENVDVNPLKVILQSQIQSMRVNEKDNYCMSTTHRTLFVLAGELRFQFNDSGICDWKAFDDFKEAYIGNL